MSDKKSDQGYHSAAVNRTAALLGSPLICFAPRQGADGVEAGNIFFLLPVQTGKEADLREKRCAIPFSLR